MCVKQFVVQKRLCVDFLCVKAFVCKSSVCKSFRARRTCVQRRLPVKKSPCMQDFETKHMAKKHGFLNLFKPKTSKNVWL